LDLLLDSDQLTGKMPKAMIREGSLSFSDTKQGRSLARVLILISSWLFPPKQDDGSTLWGKAEYPSTNTSAECNRKKSSSLGCYLGFSSSSNRIIVRYAENIGTHVYIYNESEDKASGWVDISEKNS
jgi:hypothetical protein